MAADSSIGHRATAQRTAILDVLRSTDTHPDAAWIYDQVRGQLPRISLGTVYRNLKQMAEEHVIVALPEIEGTRRWDARSEPHDHVICVECGRILDVDLGSVLDQAMDLVEERTGCRVTEHDVRIRGICPDCLKRQVTEHASG